MVAVCALSGCGQNEEECFKKATESFGNYTATLVYDMQREEKYECKVEVDGAACKATYSDELNVSTEYYKEQGGKVYRYRGANSGWTEVSYSKLSDVLADGEAFGYLSIFQKFFYDDFEKDGDYLKMKNNALESYSKMLDETLDSVKLKLGKDRFDSAVAVIAAEGGSLRIKIDYTFEKYGSTSVTLPE